MNKERLLNVAKALRESPVPAKFDMDSYAHACGTPACALGHYAGRADLQDSFFIRKPRYGDDWGSSVALLDHPDGASIDFNDTEVMEHFDLDDEQVTMLFGPTSDDDDRDGRLADSASTPFEAAEYIERFMAEH